MDIEKEVLDLLKSFLTKDKESTKKGSKPTKKAKEYTEKELQTIFSKCDMSKPKLAKIILETAISQVNKNITSENFSKDFLGYLNTNKEVQNKEYNEEDIKEYCDIYITSSLTGLFMAVNKAIETAIDKKIDDNK